MITNNLHCNFRSCSQHQLALRLVKVPIMFFVASFVAIIEGVDNAQAQPDVQPGFEAVTISVIQTGLAVVTAGGGGGGGRATAATDEDKGHGVDAGGAGGAGGTVTDVVTTQGDVDDIGVVGH